MIRIFFDGKVDIGMIRDCSKWSGESVLHLDRQSLFHRKGAATEKALKP